MSIRRANPIQKALVAHNLTRNSNFMSHHPPTPLPRCGSLTHNCRVPGPLNRIAPSFPPPYFSPVQSASRKPKSANKYGNVLPCSAHSSAHCRYTPTAPSLLVLLQLSHSILFYFIHLKKINKNLVMDLAKNSDQQTLPRTNS